MSEQVTIDLTDYARAQAVGTLFGRRMALEWRAANPDANPPKWQAAICPQDAPLGVPAETWQAIVNEAAAREWDRFFDIDWMVRTSPRDRT